MYEPVQKCTNCGAGLTLDDLRGSNCKYCGTVFPHKAQAAQHADMAMQVMNQVMAQQAQVQDQWRAAYGFGPTPPGPAMPPPPGAPGSPYASPQALAAVQFAHAGQIQNQVQKTVSRTITLVVVVVVLCVLLGVGGAVASLFLVR